MSVEGESNNNEELLSETLSKEVSDQTTRAVDEYIERQLKEIQELLGPQERRVLALLYEKDPTTFEHSVGVAHIGYEEYEEFQKDLEAEGITKEVFLRACTLHDAGKLMLPECILQNTKSWADFAKLFEEQQAHDPDFVSQRTEASQQHETHQMPKGTKVNYYDLVSLRVLFKDNPQALEECKAYGFDADSTSFMDVIRSHQENSRKIINQLDIPEKDTIAELARSHHPYEKREGEDFPNTKEVLRFTEVTAELLHLNDVYEAMTQKRSYHRKLREVEALHFVMEQIQQGEFKETIGKRWIHRFLEKMQEQQIQIDSKDQNMYDELATFSSFETAPTE